MNFDICEVSEYEKDYIFLKVIIQFVQKIFRLYINKHVKAAFNLIFPKCLVVLGKWGAGRNQFHI